MNDKAEEGRLVAEDSQIAVLNRSEIEQQIETARRFPRSLKHFRAEALDMCTLSESIADQCMYALPRDGKTIEGPSARFAEIIVSAWGNCRAGARVVDDSGEFVTAQGVFHDLERNVAITYEVQRRITGKNGRRYSADMIGVTANAACSIALRNAILKGVPKAFWEDMYNEVRKVIMGDIKTLANRRATAVEMFKKFGISEAQICAKLEVAGIEDVGLEHLVVLKGMLTAIREGDTTPEQAFDVNRPGLSVAAATAKSSPERDAVMQVLRAAAAEGKTALDKQWKALSAAERELVGVGIEEIKASIGEAS
jgi:molybdopterin-biosynthesis enzyme MoeA-like protein